MFESESNMERDAQSCVVYMRRTNPISIQLVYYCSKSQINGASDLVLSCIYHTYHDLDSRKDASKRILPWTAIIGKYCNIGHCHASCIVGI